MAAVKIDDLFSRLGLLWRRAYRLRQLRLGIICPSNFFI